MTRKFILKNRFKATAHGQSEVFRFGSRERPVHVIMKILLWGLYLPQYPDLEVEIKVDDRYKPDVVSIDQSRAIKDINSVYRFWGESGRVGADKIESLVKRYPHTHFAIAKWEKNLIPLENTVREALAGRDRTAPFDLIRFQQGDAERFISDDGHVTVTHTALSRWIRINPDD